MTAPAAQQLIAKCLNGTDAADGIGGGEINQVIRVNCDRPKRKFAAALTETRSIRFRNQRAARTRPHARAAGKNLHGVAAQFLGDIQRMRDVSGYGSVNADAKAAVLHAGASGGGTGSGRYSSSASYTNSGLFNSSNILFGLDAENCISYSN